ncbi:sugar ABC transporter ATP-binding protein [uncultured Sphaerochaeta sp.]|uniref:sugar ABC transporter ATP-binding protein n=1 Tax=uncultured Sphaerochaeta sp. TaxID=886478 RepID=UPI002A0A1BF5|nr:sugar ABC transporter ATP-binding protein [uncultured Sphaerochaeta sp.]
MSSLLEMNNIKKSFSGAKALDGVDFTLEQGEVHALLGENGAGKSTLIKILGGIIKPDDGIIHINGEKVSIENVSDARGLGIGVIHQEIVLVPYISVAKNIFLGREPVSRLGILDEKQINTRAQEMTDSLGLSLDVTKNVEELTIAQQQMVEIVKAISFNVKVLVMDEPTSSLSEEEVGRLFETISLLKKQGVSIIYISHRMDELFRISDRITVIRDGIYVGMKNTKETTVEELVSMMVGRTLESFYSRTFNNLSQAKTVLEVENLSAGKTFHNVSFKVRAGEILGFAGLMGAGRSEIMMSLFGCTPHRTEGTAFLNGKEIDFKTPLEAIKNGIGFVPEDRKGQGLVLSKSVGYNITLASLHYIMKNFVISKTKRKATIDTYISDLKIKAISNEVEVSSLSGGNQQKVVLAKWLATRPCLLILDEPTRGVDVGAKFEIYSIINKLAAQGMAIVFISSELPEIVNMCDSVCVIRSGRLVKQIPREQLSQKYIMSYAAGGSETE